MNITQFTESDSPNRNKTYDLIVLRQEELNILTNTPFKTKGQFTYTPEDQSSEFSGFTEYKIFLHRLNEIRPLISILGFLATKKSEYETAAIEILGMAVFPSFMWYGYTMDDWKHDIQLRIEVISITPERNNIANIIDDMQKIKESELSLKYKLDKMDKQ